MYSYLSASSTPRYSHQTLTKWYHSDIPYHNNNLLRYFSSRTSMVLEILDAAEVVTKTAYASLAINGIQDLLITLQ